MTSTNGRSDDQDAELTRLRRTLKLTGRALRRQVDDLSDEALGQLFAIVSIRDTFLPSQREAWNGRERREGPRRVATLPAPDVPDWDGTERRKNNGTRSTDP